MIRNIIFDLDLTLVDTSSLESYRDSGDWHSAYMNISKCSLYPGVRKMLDSIKYAGISMCIVSTSPRAYVAKVANYFHIPVDNIVGFHDVQRTKPSPEGMNKALSILGCSSSDAISFGDRNIDIQASRAAGILSVACLWGTKDVDELLSANPNFIIETPMDILSLCKAL